MLENAYMLDKKSGGSSQEVLLAHHALFGLILIYSNLIYISIVYQRKNKTHKLIEKLKLKSFLSNISNASLNWSINLS